jgi:hypothetical protein
VKGVKELAQFQEGHLWIGECLVLEVGRRPDLFAKILV